MDRDEMSKASMSDSNAPSTSRAFGSFRVSAEWRMENGEQTEKQSTGLAADRKPMRLRELPLSHVPLSFPFSVSRVLPLHRRRHRRPIIVVFRKSLQISKSLRSNAPFCRTFRAEAQNFYPPPPLFAVAITLPGAPVLALRIPSAFPSVASPSPPSPSSSRNRRKPRDKAAFRFTR